MTKLVAATVALGLLCAPQATFRIGVEGVRVDVKVTAGGRPVGDLTVRDFDLRDSGVPQQIESVTLEDVPLAVTIVLDVSDSVSGERLEHLKKATRAALDGIKGDDRFALLAFSQGIRRLSPFTADRVALASAIDRIRGAGGTSVYDAAYIALTQRDERAGRSLVLLCTDGWDTASWLPAGAVFEAARRSDAVLYAVSLKYSVQPAPFRVDASAGLPLGFPEDQRPDRFLNALTDATGGDVFFADTTKDLTPRFVAILKDFRNRYLLTYTPQGVPHGGWHPIQVTVKRGGAKVSARRGYSR